MHDCAKDELGYWLKLSYDVTVQCRHVRYTDCPGCCVTNSGICALSDVFDVMFTQAIDEVRDFMKVNGVATKERQKLMRNLRVCLHSSKFAVAILTSCV